MGNKVVNPNEIELNSIRYPISGKVRPSLISQFPSKVVIGDYTRESEQVASSWVISDQRGGILIEEMEESIHQDQCYWSNCNLNYKGHIILPPLATDCGTGQAQAQVAYVSAGTGSGVAGDVTPAYPASMSSGDLMILQVTVRNLTDTPTTPTGWAALYSADATSTGKQWLYHRVANGEESGTLTVTTNSTDLCMGRIYAFRNVALSSFTEGGGFATGVDDSIEIPSITTTSTKRLAVAFVCVNDNEAIAAATGETGGDWAEAVAEYTTEVGDDGCIQLQTATMATAGTISGGVSTINADPWGVRAFALIPFTPGTQDVYLIFEYSDVVYAFYDHYLQSFDNNNDDFLDSSHIFRANPTDVMVFDDACLVAFGENDNIYQKTLPSLERSRLIDNFQFDEWVGGYPTGWGFEILGGTVTQNTDTSYIHDGLFSVKFNGDASGNGIKMRQKLPFSSALRGKTVTVTAYGKEEGVGSDATIGIKDGQGSTTTEFSNTTFGKTTVAHTIGAWSTTFEVEIDFPNMKGTDYLYVDYIEISIAGFTDWLDMGETGKYFTSLGWTMYMVNEAGEFYTSKAGIEWVYKTEVPVPFGGVSSLFVDRDAFGSMIVYVGTQVGTFAYDDMLEELVQTDLRLPEHPTAALHPTSWRLGTYVPAGLDVLHYIAGTTATITSVGLDKRGGLPSEYQGEITYMEDAYNNLFALVDSTYGGGASYSTLMAYDGGGWQCAWVSSTANRAAKCILVTSAYDEYRVFWAADNRVYHITLQRNLLNPLKIVGTTFALNAVHITPWFDGGVAWNKLALEIELFCKGITDDEEEVVVEYRIDHTNTDLTTGWLPLDTIEANGSTTISFAAGVGVAFRTIQFRFSLDRRAGTDTLTPDIQEVKFKYLKLLPPLWGWTFTVDCTKNYDGRTGRQLIEALITAAETETLLDFVFTDTSADAVDTRKVKIKSIIGDVETGEIKEGTYQCQVIEV